MQWHKCHPKSCPIRHMYMQDTLQDRNPRLSCKICFRFPATYVMSPWCDGVEAHGAPEQEHPMMSWTGRGTVYALWSDRGKGGACICHTTQPSFARVRHRVRLCCQPSPVVGHATFFADRALRTTQSFRLRVHVWCSFHGNRPPKMGYPLMKEYFRLRHCGLNGHGKVLPRLLRLRAHRRALA